MRKIYFETIGAKKNKLAEKLQNTLQFIKINIQFFL